jgi:hypothetical protein
MVKEEQRPIMETTSQERSRMRKLIRLFAVLAILAACYGPAYFAPAIHATTSSATGHPQLVDTCYSGNGHC